MPPIRSNRRRLPIASAVAGFVAATTTADTITVCASGCAFTSINAAIAAAEDGDVIQLAAETYLEGAQIDTLGKAITIRGTTGEDGLPTTVLDGGGVHRVATCREGEGAGTVLVDLVLRNGFPTEGPTSESAVSGGGILLLGTSPTISNCTFVDNVGRFGAGILCFIDCAPTVSGCRFLDSEAEVSAAGLFSYYSAPTVDDCTFAFNVAQYGAGVFFQDDPPGGDLAPPGRKTESAMPPLRGPQARQRRSGPATPSVSSCLFLANHALVSGGALHDYQRTDLVVSDCEFVLNAAERSGGGMYAFLARPTLEGCVFDSNTANYGGGGFWEGGSGSVTTCEFTGNLATLQGGGASLIAYEGETTRTIFLDCTFRANVSGEIAGGLNVSNSRPQVVDCTFDHNTAAEHGGALRLVDGDASLRGCRLLGNLATSEGGGVFAEGSGDFELLDCTIEANRSERGGGIALRDSVSPTFDDCHLLDNAASDAGGGLLCGGESRPTFAGCRFHRNLADDGGAIRSDESARPNFVDCRFEGNRATLDGGTLQNLGESVPLFQRCVIQGNIAGGAGGGLWNPIEGGMLIVDTLVCGNAPDQVHGPWSDLGGGCVRGECLQADFDCDGRVEGEDLGILLRAFGTRNARVDLAGSGMVDASTLGLFFADWGRLADVDRYQVDDGTFSTSVGAPGATISWGNAFQATTPRLLNLAFGFGVRVDGSQTHVGEEIAWHVDGAASDDPQNGLELLDAGTHRIRHDDWGTNGVFDVVDVDIDLTGHPWFFVVATHVDEAVVAGAYPGVQAENIGDRSWVVTAFNRDGPPDFETATRTSDSGNPLIRGTWIIRGNLEP